MKELNEKSLINTNRQLNKEALVEWMEKNLPKHYTKRDYEDFYLFYKKSILNSIRRPDVYEMKYILIRLDIAQADSKMLGLDDPSPIETLIAMELKTQKIPYIHQFPLGNYRLDFAIQYEGKRIDLECDGQEFHKKDYKQERRDRIRDSYVISQGWLPVRFFGAQIRKNPVHCVEIIKNLLGRKQE